MMTLLFLKSYGFYSCAFITEALQPHESCFFSDIERYFTKSARYSWSHDVTDFLFSFHNGPFAGLICLEWWAARAAALNLWYTLSKSAFSFNVMTFLCFLGAFLASLMALHMGPLVLFKAYGIALNTMNTIQE